MTETPFNFNERGDCHESRLSCHRNNDFWIKGGGGEALLQGVITRAQQSPHALPGKVAVIGFSLGGASSLTYAARMQDLVSAVVVSYRATYYITNADDYVKKNQSADTDVCRRAGYLQELLPH